MNFDDIMTASHDRLNRFRAARDTIDRLITHAPDCSTDSYRADDAHDIAMTATRCLLIERDDADLADELRDSFRMTIDYASMIAELRTALTTIIDDDHSDAREYLTELALSFSLCPLHMIDYAICFDDEPDECAAIRTIHPSHDT